jgi:hypothetical protein
MNHHSCLVSVELAGFAVNLAADGDRVLTGTQDEHDGGIGSEDVGA